MVVADRCGLISGRDVDKSEWFDVFYGGLETAPMISECPVSLECRVIETVSLGHMSVFIGEIVEVYADEDITREEGKPTSYADMERLDPLIYCPETPTAGSVSASPQASTKAREEAGAA